MDVFTYSCVPDHAIDTLRGLDVLRQDSPLCCDFALVIDGSSFPCHRSILCLHSKYFRAMISGNFMENSHNKTTLKNVDESSLKTILDFLYTGKIEIDQTSVEKILRTATRLEFQKIIDICVSYLRHQIDETNSLAIYNFGKVLAIPELAEAARHFTYERLETVFGVNDVVKDMTSKEVATILEDKLARDHGEEQRLMSIMKWINFDRSRRLQEFEKLIQSVDWSRLSTKFILRTLLYYPLVTSSKVMKDLIVNNVKKVLENSACARGDEVVFGRYPSVRWRNRTRILGGDEQSCVQEVLLLVGGLTLGEAERGDCSQPNVMCFLPRKNTWETRTSWPERRLRGFSLTKFYNDVVVTGGCDFIEMKRYNMKRCWKYNVEEDSWLRIIDMHTSRSFHSSCQVNGELFVIGGAFADKIDMEVYCENSDAWTAMKDFAPRFVRNFVATPCNGKIMLLGSGENSPSLVLQCYNPSVAQWSQFRSPNVPRHLSSPLCCSSQDGKYIFLIGDNSKKIFLFNPNTNEWSRGEDMQNLHSNGGMAAVGGTIYVTGGHWEEDGYLDEMESMDVETGLWISKGPLPYLWLYHSCTTILAST